MAPEPGVYGAPERTVKLSTSPAERLPSPTGTRGETVVLGAGPGVECPRTLAQGAGAASGGALGGLVSVLGIVAIVQGVLALAFAYGAWTLKPWAWTLGIVAFGISLVLAVLGMINGDFSGQIISAVIAVAILYYLFTPPVKAAFGRPA